MKLTIERSVLMRGLAHVQSVVERRNTIPILSNVLLEARDGELRLTATDMDLAINERVPAAIDQEGATTAAAHLLHDIVRKLPDGAQVSLANDTESGRLVLASGRSRFKLSCLPVEDFPLMMGGEMPVRFTLEAAALRTLIDRTRFAISTEETRYYLNGIYIHASEPAAGEEEEAPRKLRAVATDGHRLALMEMALPEGAADMPGAIVPRKAINELRKLVDETSDSVAVDLSETRIRFSFDGTILTSKLIDGTFPDYERVIPTGNNKLLQVDRRAFSAAVDRVSTIATEKTRAVKLAVGNGNLALSASSAESSSASEELEVSYADTPLEIGFNARYLLDITQQIEGESAQLAMSDAAAPTTVSDPTDPSALYVLMPMRV